MINTLTPSSTPGHDEQTSQVLERISREYGKPEDKQREVVKKLGKDEFFKLMINQVQHQDPLKPYDNEQMAAQMAQFTSLEQMTNVNRNLEKLTEAQQPLQNLGAANLIGKYVTTDSSRITHTEGKYTPLAFDLAQDAATVRIVLVDEKGENVKEIEQHNVKAGHISLDWDGKKANNMMATSGHYLMQVSAVNDQNKQVMVKTSNTQMVHGVGFEGKDTVLYTGDLRRPTKMLLKDVTRIIDASQGAGTVNAGGLQIGGLDELIKKQQEAKAEQSGDQRAGAQDAPPAIPEEQSVPDAQIGLASRYMPVNAAALLQGQQKPDFAPPPTSDSSRGDGRLDLSGANVAAQDVLAGKTLPGGPAPAVPEVNPAAAARGYAAAAGNSLPSGGDNSIAGKLRE